MEKIGENKERGKEWKRIYDPEMPPILSLQLNWGERIDLEPEGDFFEGRFFTVEVEPLIGTPDVYMVRIIDADKGVVVEPENEKFLWTRLWDEFKKVMRKKGLEDETEDAFDADHEEDLGSFED